MPHAKLPNPSAMSARRFDPGDSALAALGADAARLCTARLQRVAGTHALALDGVVMPAPSVAGVARWTTLRPDSGTDVWQGPLRARMDGLPFGDESFCAVLVRFAQFAEIAPETVAAELARVLALHGTLLVVGLHPHSFWRVGVAPGRWERALQRAGLEVAQPVRCGSPWPRDRGAAGIPGWLIRGMGGAWVMEAHHGMQAAIPLRRTPAGRHAVEPSLLPGARRQRA